MKNRSVVAAIVFCIVSVCGGYFLAFQSGRQYEKAYELTAKVISDGWVIDGSVLDNPTVLVCKTGNCKLDHVTVLGGSLTVQSAGFCPGETAAHGSVELRVIQSEPVPAERGGSE